MARISFSCLCPASWHFTLPSVSLCFRQRLALLGLLIGACLLLLVTFTNLWQWKPDSLDSQFERYLARYRALEATDTENPGLSYGVVIDCGSSGSRVFVYFWPPHNGNPHDLLDIRQMRDHSSEPVVKKIKPGISTMAKAPEKASDYMKPLLSFAAAHVPKAKHKETPLYILCTAGMRLLPDWQQSAILKDLVRDVPLEFDFLFSESHAEVISGKQEGVYAWIGINFVLGRFDHDEEADALVSVTLADQKETLVRKRTVGILDMGGASLQIAYEVPSSTVFSSPQQEEAAKSQLADFNLGCDAQHTMHSYRVYVNTFLGFGGNFARQRYEQLVLNRTITHNRLRSEQIGVNPEVPVLDPCLPVGLEDVMDQNGQSVHVKGKGDWEACAEQLRPLLSGDESSQDSLTNTYQAPIDFSNSEFYGFSEFYYSTDDVLRKGGLYHSPTFTRAAQDYCSLSWSVLTQRFRDKLYSPHADLHRVKYQCFKSAWMHQVLHEGFHFPKDYSSLRTAQLIYDREVQWTLGAILYKTRFLPLRDIRQENIRQAHSSWLRLSFVYNHYLFFGCILIVTLAIGLYLLRLRRIHQQQLHTTSLDLLWLVEAVPLPAQELAT
ncbi:ectonucleoside triphosphate diphosphohydrolase 7 [Anolis carolinensis]|uniref:nucleoside-triphosphate phosphatase n=1 Tax=Anolis carolinensis TaxID=28377 RepID=G1KC74_ANOCA|nr:PREDICTED: ectonucleoside triphosphate diphosphohydrolase 7 [Anolis carolinensis]|eukprot:XP_003218500.1 PREDICTED: ectonucleoside triphosphate diphosphohydrolase 7 [Anolis carolinensis]